VSEVELSRREPGTRERGSDDDERTFHILYQANIQIVNPTAAETTATEPEIWVMTTKGR
jgi:hypothetical protein